MLSPYASHPSATRGRLHAELEDATRTCFQRDRDRIIHSTAFRRLEYKTQVFVNHEGDHYRTRLTHSLEVAQIARSLCRALNLNEDLGEALALAHDLGHPPFGHAGEEGLNTAMQLFGGFDHNIHTLKLITRLEQRYAEFDGLNLTWETLEGIAKHNGPVSKQEEKGMTQKDLGIDLELNTFASLEAQLASLSDDIAYSNHDIDDGLRAGLFMVDDLQAVPEIYAVFEEVKTRYPDISTPRLIHEAIRRLINRMCMDVLQQTKENCAVARIESVADVRHSSKPLVAFSPAMQDINTRMKTFLMEHMYRHYRVNRMFSKAERVVSDIFEFFLKKPDCLPTEWRAVANTSGTQETAIVVADYIAGMTDRYALKVYQQLFDVETRP